MPVKKVFDKELYNTPRFWYHVSTTLKEKEIILYPRDNKSGFNRSENEPDIERICVSPTLEQCLTAVPYDYDTIFGIYRTKCKVLAYKILSTFIFDKSITQEGWLFDPTVFVKAGILNMKDIIDFFRKKNKNFHIIEDAATSGNLSYSKEVYKWWVKHKPWKFVRFTNE